MSGGGAAGSTNREPGSRTTQELWRALVDDSLDAELRTAMSKPTNTDALFDYAVDRLLVSTLGAV